MKKLTAFLLGYSVPVYTTLCVYFYGTEGLLYSVSTWLTTLLLTSLLIGNKCSEKA